MKVLIIGLGSIAKKHINALISIDENSSIWALRSSKSSTSYLNVKDIYSIHDCPEVDFIIISNSTALHGKSIREVIKLNKPIFLEKPPFHSIDEADLIVPLVEKKSIATYTAFNLRFLDSLKHLKKSVDSKNIQEVNIYCGSFMPNWRKETDYKKVYSSNKSMGGGVHLDLIHEIDYAIWLWGKPEKITSTLRNKSKLGIDSPDYANYLLQYNDFAVNIILNYYRKDTKRTCEIVFEEDTWLCDLMKNKITSLKDNSLVFKSNQTTIDTYTDQLSYFIDCIQNDKQPSNSINESIETLKFALS